MQLYKSTALLFFMINILSSMVESTVMIEKAEVIQTNKHYFASFDLNVKQEDGTYGLDANFELIQDIPNNTIVTGKLMSYQNYKYELVADIQGKFICKFLKDEFHDWFTDEYLAQQKMIDDCPIRKGTYWFKNFAPRNIHYPIASLCPKSLSELLLYYDEKLLLHVKWYATLVKE